MAEKSEREMERMLSECKRRKKKKDDGAKCPRGTLVREGEADGIPERMEGERRGGEEEKSQLSAPGWVIMMLMS